MTPPLFPPHAVCVCGYLGSEHEAVWEGGEFKGTRSPAGGHKFAIAGTAEPDPDVVAERAEQLKQGLWRE